MVSAAVAAAALAAAASARAADDDITEYPRAYNVRVTGTEGAAALRAKVAPLLDSVTAAGDRWVGDTWSRDWAICQDDACFFEALFVARDPGLEERVQAAAAAQGLPVEFAVSNAPGTFIGVHVDLAVGDDKLVRCEEAPARAFASWGEAYVSYQAEIDRLRQLPKADVLAWVRRTLPACTFDADLVQEVKVLLNFTNRADCPLTVENMYSCRLARGLVDGTIKF
jgi:hypothetical protein